MAMSMTEMAGVFRVGSYTFFGDIANAHVSHKRAYTSSNVYLCSFEAVGWFPQRWYFASCLQILNRQL